MRRKLHTYGTLLVYALALIMCAVAVSGCSTVTWQEGSGHIVEVGLSALGGILFMYLPSGAYGVIAMIACCVAGVLTNEAMQR